MAGVTTEHSDLFEYKEMWERMRDHLSGSDAIKRGGTKYLPMLGDPNKASDQADYESYKMRAVYYEATKRTRDAMLGALLMKPPQYNNFPEKFMGQLKRVTMDGFSMETFIRNVLSELIGVSRAGVLLDRGTGPNDPLYFVQYMAEDIRNWRFERVNDEIHLTLLVLHETVNEADGRFDTEERSRYRVLELIDGVYIQTVFEGARNDKNEVVYTEQEPVVPTNKGVPLDYIPFVFFTPLGDVPTLVEPVLTPIATINNSHYMTSADLEHGRHFTGLPTAWVAGFDPETELKIGSQIAWVSSDPSARAGFLEFTGQGLRTLEVALAEKQEQMATMGARMLRPPKTGVEAAETARIYQSAESSSLGHLAGIAGECFTKLIGYWLEWQGSDPTDVSIDLNTDYIDTRLDSASLTAIVAAWMNGAISRETLFYNLQQGELIPDGVDFEEEAGRIEMEGPALNDEPDTRKPDRQ